MDDTLETGFATAPEAGQPSEAPPQEQPKYVTEERFSQLEEKLTRTLQSLTDKQESRIKEELDNRLDEVKRTIAEARAAGYEVPQEVEKQMERDAYQNALSSAAQNQAAQPPVQQPQPKPEDVEKVDVGTSEIVAQYKFTLNASDPEARLLDTATLDPDAYLSSFNKAMEAKAMRLGRPLPPQQLPGNPAARVAAPGGAPAGGIEAMNEELNRLQNKTHPTPADLKRRKELTEELLKHVPRG